MKKEEIDKIREEAEFWIRHDENPRIVFAKDLKRLENNKRIIALCDEVERLKRWEDKECECEYIPGDTPECKECYPGGKPR